ncbi:Glycosyl transferase family 2 [Reichenbachiella agariperforans]|uniref:Glycosyl transferase family 2 n=1 Tax=Reichenbachiella agariperforans TaxID=156994 RepID=A0A1M6STK6_REIAG|nr:glycosyltransferase family 2 protein [Reichenbachiella agariperforans]SHK47977.1 Glycosyl transferase family 2 [Reichenbachiella agariperforans]
MPPLVSVILPYYNAEATLETAVQSILSQYYVHLELLLIDNNSSDSGMQIAQRYAAKDTRVRLIHEPRQGVVYAANTGIRLARGAYIARMDADDTCSPNRISSQMEQLTNDATLSISATQVTYGSSNRTNDFQHFIDWSNSLLSHEQIFLNRFVEFPVVNPTLMVKKEVFNQIGLFREGDFPEDYEWFLRAMEAGCHIEKLAEPLQIWQDSETRLTRTDTRYETEAFFQIKTQYLANVLQQKNQKSVWVWGAGKLALRRSKWLEDHHIHIAGYIDIKKNKHLADYSCVHFEDINPTDEPFIISYITNRGRRDEIRAFLNQKGYKEGHNYIIAG